MARALEEKMAVRGQEGMITEGVAERKVERKSQNLQWKIRNARRAFRTALFRTPFRRSHTRSLQVVVVRAIRVIIIRVRVRVTAILVALGFPHISISTPIGNYLS